MSLNLAVHQLLAANGLKPSGSVRYFASPAERRLDYGYDFYFQSSYHESPVLEDRIISGSYNIDCMLCSAPLAAKNRFALC